MRRQSLRNTSRAPRPVPPDTKAADLLFEIGTEELPATDLPSLIEQLGSEAAGLLQAHHLPFQQIQTFGTPRRLVLHIRGLANIQRKPAEEIRGPSKQAAFDGAGKPLSALLGFLRSRGGTLDQIKLVDSGKGAYVYLLKQPIKTPTANVLSELLTPLIGKLRSPKTMRWDATGVRFARPVRWLLALYGNTPVRVTFGRLTSTPSTWVDGPTQPRRIAITSIPGYFQNLQKAGIILEQERRRQTIEQMVERIAKQCHGRTASEMLSHGLLEEVTFLVEQPQPLMGTFDEKYLTLPRDVLLASMAKHQRVFAVESSGKLLPHWVAILEGQPRRIDQVRQIVERILNARLADSLLFWSNDHKSLPLQHMAKALTGVSFHEKLGSMEQKVLRLAQLSPALASMWQLSAEETSRLARAAELCKADLVSTMVKEFPTLQGVMGKYYAKDSGEPQALADAIEEHYLPLANRLPQTLLGSALAILDKYDTLANYFAIGIKPTGDQDPFGLRRAAQGIVEVAWAVKRPLHLSALFERWHALVPQAPATIAQEIQRYLLERLCTFAWPAPAPTTDCIDAAIASQPDDVVDVMQRAIMLKAMTNDPLLLKAAKVIERTTNILRGSPSRQAQVDPSRLQEPLEQRLWELYGSHEQQMHRLTQERAYAEATQLFGRVFFEPLHEFFDRVLVNVPDEALKQNRLALMRAINTLYTGRIADLSKLTILQRAVPAP